MVQHFNICIMLFTKSVIIISSIEKKMNMALKDPDFQEFEKLKNEVGKKQYTVCMYTLRTAVVIFIL